MSPSRPNDDQVNRETFTIELQRLVAQARDDGAELEGGYNVRSPDPDIPDYTVEITEQEKLVSDGGTNAALANVSSLTGDRDTRDYQRRLIDRFLLVPSN